MRLDSNAQPLTNAVKCYRSLETLVGGQKGNLAAVDSRAILLTLKDGRPFYFGKQSEPNRYLPVTHFVFLGFCQPEVRSLQ